MENMDIELESETESDTFVASKSDRERKKFCYVVFLMNYAISFFLPYIHIQTYKHTSDLVTVKMCVCVCLCMCVWFVRLSWCSAIVLSPSVLHLLPYFPISQLVVNLLPFSLCVYPVKKWICFCLQIYHNHFFFFFFFDAQNKVHDKVQYAFN